RRTLPLDRRFSPSVRALRTKSSDKDPVESGLRDVAHLGTVQRLLANSCCVLVGFQVGNHPGQRRVWHIVRRVCLKAVEMTFGWFVFAWVLLSVPLPIIAGRCLALKDEAPEAAARILTEAPGQQASKNISARPQPWVHDTAGRMHEAGLVRDCCCGRGLL